MLTYNVPLLSLKSKFRKDLLSLIVGYVAPAGGGVAVEAVPLEDRRDVPVPLGSAGFANERERAGLLGRAGLGAFIALELT